MITAVLFLFVRRPTESRYLCLWTSRYLLQCVPGQSLGSGAELGQMKQVREAQERTEPEQAEGSNNNLRPLQSNYEVFFLAKQTLLSAERISII